MSLLLPLSQLLFAQGKGCMQALLRASAMLCPLVAPTQELACPCGVQMWEQRAAPGLAGLLRVPLAWPGMAGKALSSCPLLPGG